MVPSNVTVMKDGIFFYLFKRAFQSQLYYNPDVTYILYIIASVNR